MPSSKGLMAPSIVDDDAVQGETFLPGQIFVFSGIVLRANSLGHLEQIDSYAPGHQVRFGSLNYVVDIRGGLIFNGFETAAIAPPRSDERDLNPSSDQVLEMVPITATTLDPEQFTPSEATESAAFVAGLNFLSSDGATWSGSKARVVTGAISWVWPDDRSKSCSSWWLGAAAVVSNLSKIKSPRISVMYFKLPNLT